MRHRGKYGRDRRDRRMSEALGTRSAGKATGELLRTYWNDVAVACLLTVPATPSVCG